MTEASDITEANDWGQLDNSAGNRDSSSYGNWIWDFQGSGGIPPEARANVISSDAAARMSVGSATALQPGATYNVLSFSNGAQVVMEASLSTPLLQRTTVSALNNAINEAGAFARENARPAGRTARGVLTLGTAYEVGASRDLARTQISNLQTLLNIYSTANGTGQIDVREVNTHSDVSGPQGGTWTFSGDSSPEGIIRELRDSSGGIGVLFASSSLGVNGSGATRGGWSYGGLGSIVTANPAYAGRVPFVLAHEIGHVVGWSGPTRDPEEPDHSTDPNNPMLRTAPTSTVTTRIDSDYYNRVSRWTRTVDK